MSDANPILTQAVKGAQPEGGSVRQLQVPDPERMEAAVRAFLSAAGLDLTHPDLQTTAARTRQAWLEEFLAGYSADIPALLEERFPASTGTPVLVSGLRFISVCPHHLLPYSGVARVAYVPRGEVVGFSRLAKVVDVLSRRLLLQESLTWEIASALMRHLGCEGSACLLESTQTCMALRGVQQHESRCTTVAWLGAFEGDATLQRLVLGAEPLRPAEQPLEPDERR